MRRALAGGAALGLALLAVPAHASRGSESVAMTIRLVSITTQFKTPVDKPPKGEPNKGDVVWAKSTLRNAVPQFGKPKGAIVGSDIATFTVVSPPEVGDMKVTAKLPGGTIRVAGRIREGWSTVPVIGGTGVFAGVRGTSTTSPYGSSANKALNVYRLRLP